MSELRNFKSEHALRRRLLATASVLVLISGCDAALAEDISRPTVWIELGGQLEGMNSYQSPFTPPFVVANPNSPAFQPQSPEDAQKSPRNAFGGEARFSFEPEGSDWVFSVAARYGRANAKEKIHQQSPGEVVDLFGQDQALYFANYSDVKAKQSESHAILDFAVGKDVGLGMFGTDSTSIVSLGVRFAQFSSKIHSTLYARPDVRIESKYFNSQISVPFKYFHSYAASSTTKRSFRGIGPSLSWQGSSPVFGHPDSAELTFDWGLNGAILFGRQKVHTQHHTSGRYYNGFVVVPSAGPYSQYDHPAVPHERSRSVTVPNVGGFAGLSLKFPNAKVSLGYRADFFFGAMDGGVDVRKTYDRHFNGPFATISIGLGG